MIPAKALQGPGVCGPGARRELPKNLNSQSSGLCFASVASVMKELTLLQLSKVEAKRTETVPQISPQISTPNINLGQDRNG